MDSQIKKEQKAQRKFEMAQSFKQMIENLAQIPSHRAITAKVDGRKLEVKVDLNFKKTSDLCIIGTMGARPNCPDLNIIRILGRYKDYATEVRVAIFFNSLEDERKIIHRQVRYFQALRDCLNQFKHVGNGNLRFGAKTIGYFQWIQLRNLVYFYELEIPDWKLHIGYDVSHQDKDGKQWTESVWKAVLPGWDWDKKYLSWLKVVRQRREIVERKAILDENRKLEVQKKKLVEVGEVHAVKSSLEHAKEKVGPSTGCEGKKKRVRNNGRKRPKKNAPTAAATTAAVTGSS